MNKKTKIIGILIITLAMLFPIVSATWVFSDNSGDNPFETNAVPINYVMPTPKTSFVDPMIITNEGTTTVNGNYSDETDGNWIYLSVRDVYLGGVYDSDQKFSATTLYVNFSDHATTSQQGWAYATGALLTAGTHNKYIKLTDDAWKNFTWKDTAYGHNAYDHPTMGYELAQDEEVRIAVGYYTATTSGFDTGSYFGEQGYPAGGDYDGVSWAIYEWVEV